MSDNENVVKVKAFLNKDGVMCVLTDSSVPLEIEFIDAVEVECESNNVVEYDDVDDPVDNYINQLCADGFNYVADSSIVVTNMLCVD